MKKQLLLCLIFGSAFMPVRAQTADEAAVKKVIETETSSYYAGNYEGWANTWAHEPYILWAINSGEEGGYFKMMGWSELDGGMKGAFTNQSTPVPMPNIARENYIVRQNGTMAFATFEQVLTDPTGKQPTRRSRETRVLEKQGGAWKLIYACVLDPKPEPAGKAKAMSMASSTEFKKGTYFSVAPNGEKWATTYGDDGKVTVKANGKLMVEGTYKLMGDTMEVMDVSGSIACKGVTKPGKYKWGLDGKSLFFTKVEDECGGRANAYAQAWIME